MCELFSYISFPDCAPSPGWQLQNCFPLNVTMYEQTSPKHKVYLQGISSYTLTSAFGLTAMNTNWPPKSISFCLVHLFNTTTLQNNTLKDSNLDLLLFFSGTVDPSTVTSQQIDTMSLKSLFSYTRLFPPKLFEFMFYLFFLKRLSGPPTAL